MSSRSTAGSYVVLEQSDAVVLCDFVPLIRSAMSRNNIPQRKLALLTGISKSRLGLLLHSDSNKRSPMMVNELQIILHAIGVDLVEAYIRIKTFEAVERALVERHDTMISMLCDAFIDLPQRAIVTISALEGVDGSETRRDWAAPVQRAIVRRLVEEVAAKVARRKRLVESDDFRL